MSNQRLERGSTFLQFTHPEDEMGGRCKAVHTHIVVGNIPVPNYPKASDWVSETLRDEPPLGLAIDDQEPVGTEAEIQASLNSNAPAVAVGDDVHLVAGGEEREAHSVPSPSSSLAGHLHSAEGNASSEAPSLSGVAHSFRKRI
jgi:hypothetical protein